MELGDGHSGSGNEENNVEVGEKCEKVEEMAKLKEESIITNKARPDQVEKTKGKGLKKWKRRRRETNKDVGHVQEPQRMLHKRVNPHAGQLDTSKGASSGSKQKNEIIESEPSVGNNIAASSSILGFTHPDRDSDSGSCYAVLNLYPIGCSEDQSFTSFPKDMAENLIAEELLNDIDFGLFENREEMNYSPLYGDGIELPIGMRAFESGDMKRPAGPTKKARAEKFESNLNSEDPIHEHDDSSISTGRIVHKCEGISGNHVEVFPATCIWDCDGQENLDDHGESSCSTANNIGISAVSTSGHINAVMTKSDRNLVGSNKHESLDDFAESSCSRVNNLGTSVVRASGHSKAVIAKSGSNTSLGNRKWSTEEFKLWCENFEPENSSFERQDCEEAQILESEILNGSHGECREGEDIRENPVLTCDVAHNEESFASAATAGAKEMEEKPGSQAHENGTHLQPGESACLVQALTQLKTAEEALQQEVQQMKDLGKLNGRFQMKNSDHGIFSDSDSVNKHLYKNDESDVANGSHVVEMAEREWASPGSQLNKMNEKLKLLQKELESTNERTLSEQTNVKKFEVPSKDQEIKYKETKPPSEGAVSELQLVQDKCKEMERELEEQYKENMQAEIEYLILNNAAIRSVSLAENGTFPVQMKGSELGICSDSDSISKHLNKYDSFNVPNGSHVEEKAERERPLEGNQLNKELEAANKRTSSEQTKVKELEVLCKDQEIKQKETKLPSEGSASELQSLQEKCKEMEKELEEQYKESMQAEIEFLMLSDAATRSIALVENETSLLQEQKDLVIKQLQTALKLKDAEGRALSLKDQVTELENACGSLLEVEESPNVPNLVPT
ncbi:hypothetical protein SUGI_0090480 [Cryptomeria japonica]|nr:hypothetical protein SUGI_0090480 [Cryptomeria japonica]